MKTTISARHRASRIYQLLILVLLLRPFGNLSLAWGMKHLSRIVSLSPLPYLRAMLNPYVAAGIILLILALLVRMALLSLADLTYVVPMTAGGYIISTVLARVFLQENVSAESWVGTVLVFLGTALVGPTSRTSTMHPLGPVRTHNRQS
ncbi:MAG: EamA family transporter [Acidobacteriaceae bacterium]|nr:EamA family transporter [Acidobacteriaceae bacterium]MBV9306272.1 EamA family transporter [Acidobacteriaceae bacterium]